MNLQRQVLLTLRFVKLRRFLGSLFYPLQRDWLELRSRSHNMEATEQTGGAEKAKPIQRGGHFYFKHLELEVTFLATDLIRVDWQPGKVPLPYGIARKDWEEVEIDFQDKENCWIISSSALKVIVHADGSLQFQNSLGQVIREELPPQRRIELSDAV
jgi:alpha-glucosidase